MLHFILRPWGIPTYRILLFVLAVGLSARSGSAQELLYGLNERGRLSLNATILDSLDSEYNEDDGAAPEQRWVELIVEGSDRYALRRDGLVFKNGKRLYRLPNPASTQFDWIGMAVSGGSVYTLRMDGIFAINGEATTIFPAQRTDDNIFPFRQVLVQGSDYFVLRADGAIFKNIGTTPIFAFTAGTGLAGFGDGLELDTIWTSMASDPVDGHIYAVRTDGRIFRGDPDDPGGEGDEIPIGSSAAELPFPALAQDVQSTDLYFDIIFTADGSWKVLNGEGEVFTEANPSLAIVDLPGDNDRKIFIDIAPNGNDFWTLRRDGRVYKNIVDTPVLNLPKSGYTRIALSDQSPDLTNFKNKKPIISVYKVIAVEGDDIAVPIIFTDGDRRVEEVVVTFEGPLPPGASWDDDNRILNWDSAGPVGAYKFAVLIDDGIAKPKAAKYKIKVIAPDPLVEKNKPPIVSKIKKVQALVDFELSLPIIATDPDGDELTFTVDTSKYPFTAGAVFDQETRTFTWTPTFDDIGKISVQLVISDGIKKKKFKIKIEIISPLIF